MTWFAVDERTPSRPVLVYAGGDYYLAVLVEEPVGSEPAFLDVHSADLVPWPSHWAELPEPPSPA